MPIPFRLLTLSYAAIGLILVVDQLLLPMFHIGRFPFKVSYFLLALWALSRVADQGTGIEDGQRSKDFRHFALAIGLIVACALLGDLIFSAVHHISFYQQTGRSVLIYLLLVFSFGLGLSAKAFNLTSLMWVLYTALALNLSFALLRTAVPGWLVDFYYSEITLEAFSEFGIGDAADLLNLTRPRGIHPNPNGAMLMVNVIVLFIYLGLRNRLILVRSNGLALGMIVLPVILAAVLASRGEFICSAVLAVANYRVIFRNASLSRRRWARTFLGGLILISVMVVALLDEKSDLMQNVSRIATLIEIVQSTKSDDVEISRNQGISRPLLAFEGAYDRFLYSPVFGSGFSHSTIYPFDLDTQYYHNDWFRLIVTSGIIGVAAMLWIIRKYCLPLGLLSLLPFAVAGLSNTFMLNIPAFLFYFFMVGVLHAKLRERSSASNRLTSAEN